MFRIDLGIKGERMVTSQETSAVIQAETVSEILKIKSTRLLDRVHVEHKK